MDVFAEGGLGRLTLPRAELDVNPFFSMQPQGNVHLPLAVLHSRCQVERIPGLGILESGVHLDLLRLRYLDLIDRSCLLFNFFFLFLVFFVRFFRG